MSVSVASISDLIAESAAYLRAYPDAPSMSFIEWLTKSAALNRWGVREVYQACLGRLPERELWQDEAENWTYPSARHRAEHIVATLTCEEFLGNIIDVLIAARPDVARIFFVHIPRTAGTALTLAIEQACAAPIWHVSFTNPTWLALESVKRGFDPLGYMLAFLAQFAGHKPQLFVVGHMSLAELLSRRWVRSGDTVFTMVREPSSLCLSVLDYIVHGARNFGDRPDGEDWRAWFDDLGCPSLYSGEVTAADLRRVLTSERFAQEYGNLICRSLSVDGTLEGALYGVDVVDCDVLVPVLAENWAERKLGLNLSLARHNASPAMAGNLLDEEDLQFIREVHCGRDIPLYAKLADKRLWQAGD